MSLCKFLSLNFCGMEINKKLKPCAAIKPVASFGVDFPVFLKALFASIREKGTVGKKRLNSICYVINILHDTYGQIPVSLLALVYCTGRSRRSFPATGATV